MKPLLTKYLCLPLLILTLALFLRTLSTLSSDLFRFGRSDTWTAYLALSAMALDVEICPTPPSPPFVLPNTPQGLYLQHLSSQHAGTKYIENANAYDRIDRANYGLFLIERYMLAGAQVHQAYRIWIPLFGPLLLLITGTPVAIWQYRRARARKRTRLGLCPTCAFDLRSHPAEPNCPQCNTPLPTKTTPKPKQKAPQSATSP